MYLTFLKQQISGGSGGGGGGGGPRPRSKISELRDDSVFTVWVGGQRNPASLH